MLALGPYKLGEPNLHDYKVECSIFNRVPPSTFDFILLIEDYLEGPLGIQGTV